MPAGRRGNVRVVVTGDASGLDKETKRSEGILGRFGPFAKRAALAGAAGVAAGTIASVKSFADYDDAMTKSLAIMGDVSEAQRGEMSDAARAVGRQTSFSAKEAGESYFYLASAGLDAQQSVKAMPQVARFAQAGNFDLATATDLVTDAQSALGLSSDKAAKNLENMTRTSDVLVKANTLANATVEQFSQSLTNKAGAAAKVLGKDIEETASVLAAFADQGLKGEQAGNALNIVWRDLQKGALENKAAFREHGVAVFDANGEMRHTSAIVGELEKALGSMSDEEKKATLGKLGFQEESQAFILTLLGSSKAIKDYDKELRKAGGITDEVARKQLKGLTGAWIKLKSQVSDVALAIGEKAAPMLEKGANALAQFIGEFQAGRGAGGSFRDTLVSIGEVIGPIALGLGNAAMAIAGFGADVLQTQAGVTLLGAAVGALTGRMVALGVAWGVSKIAAAISAITSLASTMGVLRTVYAAQTGVTNASTIAVLKHAAATRIAAAGYGTLRAAMASTGIGLLIVLAGTAAGALLGMSAATGQTANTTERLRDANRSLADAMREVRDIDIDVAQRRNNVAAANNSVERAQRRVNSLQKAGKKDTLAYREALVDLRNAKNEQKRASRDLARAEADGSRKREDGVRAARKVRSAARAEIAEQREAVAWQKKLADAHKGNEEAEGGLLRSKIALARAQKEAVNSTLELRRIQLSQAEASGASGNKIKGLKEEIRRLEGRSREGGNKVKRLREEIADLKSKRVKVDVDLNLLMPGGGVFSGAGDRKGSGWPLADAVQAGAQAMADKDPMAFFTAAAGGGLGTGRAAGVGAFVPFASRFGLGETSGYRPGDDGYHGINRAKDFAGAAPSMLAFAKFMATAFGSSLLELIYTPLGFSIKNGQRVPPYAQADHFDHVHVAAATGAVLTQPTVVLAGEEAPRHPEFFISTNPRDRDRSLGLLVQAAQALGAPGFAKGTVVSGKASWFSPADAPNTTADGKHTAADPGFAIRSHKTLGDWFWAQVGGASGMLQHIDWGPHSDTGRTIDFTRAGLSKIGAPTNITDKQAKVTWLGNTVKGAVNNAREMGVKGFGKDPEERREQTPVHGRKRLSFDEKASQADRRIARAETTAPLKDDRRAAVAKLDLLRGRKRHLEKKARGINKRLKGKLKPAVRERLLSERESILSELSSMPGEASSLIENLREGGLNREQLKKHARGFGIGVADPNAERPTARDRADLQLARAEATPEKADDLKALERLVKVSEHELRVAERSGDPREIAEATRNLTEATNNLAEALPTTADYANRDLALAELTDTLEDDKDALERLEDLAEQDLAAALATADPRDDIEAANNLKSARDAVENLNKSIDEQNELMRQQKQFEKERLELDKRLANLAEKQGPAFLAAFAAFLDGAIGGPVQRGLNLPTTPGIAAGYQ